MMALGTRSVYTPTNPGWGATATASKPIAYQPTNPGWGAAATAAKLTPRDPQSPAAKQPGTTTQAGSQPVGDPYDFSGDPVLAQIHAIGVRSRQDAQDQALAARKQAAIDYGDSDYARNILHDEATAAAAAGNPYSRRAIAKTDYGRATTALEDQINKANLFYSGARGVQLGQQADTYQRGLYGIAGEEQNQLGSIQDRLLQALTSADQQDVQGSQDAANRSLQLALSYGFDPGAGVVGAGQTIGQGATAPDLFAGLAKLDPSILLALARKKGL